MMASRKRLPHPENLLVGERWLVWYSDHVSTSRLRGKFLGMGVSYGSLWLEFKVDGEHDSRFIPWKSVYDMEPER